MAVLEVKGLSKQYPEFLLDGISFSLEEGRIMGLIGRNGAGKTTTLKSIFNIVHKSAGEIKIFGFDMPGDEQKIKTLIGYTGGAINYYQRKKLKDIAAVTRRFYTNWDANEPSNSRGEEWFAHFWKEMTWNDVAYDDPKNSQFGYICEYDDLQDETQGIYENDGYVDEDGNEFVNGGEDYNDESEDWDSEVQGGGEDYQMDPYYEDLGDDRTAIRSPWRGVQIKYPSDFYAEEDGEALRVFDGEYMYVYARNITAEALGHSEDMAAFCAAKAEEQAVADFTKLFGIPTGTDRVTKRAGDGDKRICDIKGNMFNDTADMWFKSKVFISGKNNDCIVIFTAFWRLDDQVGSDHYDQVTVTSWGRGEMYYQ